MKNKERKIASKPEVIDNSVVASIVIDTDDDFSVNDVFFLEKELEFKTLEDMKKGVFTYLNSLKFKAKKGSEYRLSGFTSMVHSEDFKESISELGDVIMSGTPHEWKIDEANAGGNQTIKVKVLKF